MSFKGKYTKGQVVGDNGLVFLDDASPQINKDGEPVSRCWFKCSCGVNFFTILSWVEDGTTKNCGCQGRARYWGYNE